MTDLLKITSLQYIKMIMKMLIPFWLVKIFLIYLLVTAIFQFIAILITGNIIEHGDINAASMSVVVFLLPGILISFGFGFIFSILDKLKSNRYFILWIFVFFVISIFSNELINNNGRVFLRVILITGFLFNLIIFGYYRMKK